MFPVRSEIRKVVEATLQEELADVPGLDREALTEALIENICYELDIVDDEVDEHDEDDDACSTAESSDFDDY